jgi:hypothetical protein
MQTENPVAELDVTNIYIYVADAVRWDALPESVSESGLVWKSVAGSIHSPTSFATLVSGAYMPHHGVTDFDCRIPDSVFTLFDVESHETRFLNSIGVSGSEDPIYSVLNQRPEEGGNPFGSASEPFIMMERGQGGHAPYGGFEGTAQEYFESRSNHSPEMVRREYYEGVREDANAFQERINHLESEGLLDETLVIYTSDHGELLGEGGLFGHNGPIRPELVYVPTVFIHPNIPKEEPHGHFGHTKLLPTILNVLGVSRDNRTIMNQPAKDEDVSFSFYQKRHDLPGVPFSGITKYDSVWDSDGGYVIPRSAMYQRGPGLVGNLFFAPTKYLSRKLFPKSLKSYWSGYKQFGNPPGNPSEFDELLTNWKESIESVSKSVSLGQDAQDRLKDLGYIN